MALKNKIDPGTARRSLAEWLSARVPDAGEVTVSDVRIPTSSGMSCETVLFNATWQEHGESRLRPLVARVAPPGDTTMSLFPSYDLGLEASIMRALAQHTQVPAPNALFTESDPAVLGGPFLVMDRIDGQVPPDDPPYTMSGWVLELEPEKQRLLIDNAVEVLVTLHDTDWKALGLHALDRHERGALGVSQYIGTVEYLYAAGAGDRPHPTITAGIEWAKRHQPADQGAIVLNWGDARIGNLLFAEDVSVAAVLDWEMACLGCREQDLGFFLFGLDYLSKGLSMPSPPGFPSESEVVERYVTLSGHEVRNLEYFKALASLMAVVVVMRVGYVMIANGLLPEDSPMPHNNPASQLMTQYMGLPAPAGTVADWTGVR
jgi:aminoglycoside phosphotransferase (APT) family kinase protein